MEYSVLVRRVVNFRIDGIRTASQRDAIQRAESLPVYFFINGERGEEIERNPDGSPITLRYVDDGEESHAYLVDEAGDEDFERSGWYASDGMTPLDPGRVCGECVRPRDGSVRRMLDSVRRWRNQRRGVGDSSTDRMNECHSGD